MSLAMVMLWMAMQRQAQEQCYVRPASDGCNTEKVCKDIFGQEGVVSSTLIQCSPSQRQYRVKGLWFGGTPPYTWTVKPPEHVIEIRTKHETKSGMIVKAGTGPFPHYSVDYITCPDGFYGHVNEPPIPNDITCERVTREVWIDNVKFGVLKETEDK